MENEKYLLMFSIKDKFILLGVQEKLLNVDSLKYRMIHFGKLRKFSELNEKSEII